MKRSRLLWVLLGGWGYFGSAHVPVSVIKWSGFVRLDSFFDTRNILGDRGDILSLFPAPKIPDAEGADINDFWKYQLSEVSTRLRCDLAGPDTHGFTPTAAIEGDFYGPTSDTVIGYRLRHAYIKLKSNTDTILIGRYWHPVRIDDCHGPVISVNDGTPVEPWARDPQIRWKHSRGTFEFIAAISMQTQGFRSNGPDGYSDDYLRRAMIPDLTFQLRHVTDEHTVGIGVEYKKLVPRLQNRFNISVWESINSACAFAYWAWRGPCVQICTKCIYGQNVVDLSSVGGYAVACKDTIMNATVDQRSYTPVQVVHAWFDIAASPDQSWVPGIFVGGLKNVGSLKPIYLDENDHPIDPYGTSTMYGRSPYHNIDYVLRVSPRLMWNSESFSAGCEVEYTRAAFGDWTRMAKIVNGKPVNVVRPLVVMYYIF